MKSRKERSERRVGAIHARPSRTPEGGKARRCNILRKGNKRAITFTGPDRTARAMPINHGSSTFGVDFIDFIVGIPIRALLSRWPQSLQFQLENADYAIGQFFYSWKMPFKNKSPGGGFLQVAGPAQPHKKQTIQPNTTWHLYDGISVTSNPH